MDAVLPAPEALSMRGTVEGFYGPPWPQAERLAHLEFSAQVGLNTYVYAPKDDPHHRARWQEPHTADELGRLAALVEAAHGLGVRFVYAISPGLSMRFTDDGDHRALVAKARQLWEVGVVSFAVFFDDVPLALSHPDDRERWPHAGAAHGEACTRFVADFLRPVGIDEPLLVCPTDYAGTAESAYRRHFAATAPPDALVCWTGRDVVVGTITRDDIDRAAASYRRRLVLWDNFPVNDFEPSRLFLGPLSGRTTDLKGSALDGVLANPMVWAAPSQIPLVSVAEWAADPGGYDPVASGDRALRMVAGPGAADLAPVVRACGSWPPGAAPDAELAAAAADALAGAAGGSRVRGAVADSQGGAAGDSRAAAAGGAVARSPTRAVGGAAILAARLKELARGCRAATEPEALVAGLRPWLDSGAAIADAGLAAVRLLSDGASPALRADARRALMESERHYADVLRSVIAPFVREVLDRTAPPAPAPAVAGPVALLVTGARRTAGDEAVTEVLERLGFSVRRGSAAAADTRLVVVSHGAEPEAIAAVAGVDVPLLAWRGFVPLGLATRGEVLIARDTVRIVDPGDPLAAGLDGRVTVYKGPSNMAVGHPGPDARVVARTVDGGDHPAVFHYPADARLADGTPAPAIRVGIFLAGDGLAPWLMTDAGRALATTALTATAAGFHDRAPGKTP